MPDVYDKRRPKWPLWLALSLLLVVEIFFVVMFCAEGVTENISTIVNSLGLLLFCVLAWRGIPWSRWLLMALLVWRVANIIVDMVSHIAPGDHRLPGSLVLLALYLFIGLIIASPLGRSTMREAA